MDGFTITVDLEITSRACSVATASRDQLTLLRGRADATTTARERRTAALRLALVVLEDKQRVGARLKLRAHQLLIRSGVAPRTNAILGHYILGIEVSNRLVALAIATRILQERAREALTSRAQAARAVIDHQNVSGNEDDKSCDKEPETHDSSLQRDFFRRARV